VASKIGKRLLTKQERSDIGIVLIAPGVHIPQMKYNKIEKLVLIMNKLFFGAKQKNLFGFSAHTKTK